MDGNIYSCGSGRRDPALTCAVALECRRQDKYKYLLLGCVVGIFSLLTSCAVAPVESITDQRIRDQIASATLVNVAFVQQTSQQSCGVAALTAMANYWGVDILEKDLLRAFPKEPSSSGYSIGELKTIAKTLGLHAFAFPSKEDFIKEQISLGRPVIVPLRKRYEFKKLKNIPLLGSIYGRLSKRFARRYDHYVVLTGFDENGVWMMDPANGIQYVRTEDFKAMWTPHKKTVLLVAKSGGSKESGIIYSNSDQPSKHTRRTASQLRASP